MLHFVRDMIIASGFKSSLTTKKKNMGNYHCYRKETLFLNRVQAAHKYDLHLLNSEHENWNFKYEPDIQNQMVANNLASPWIRILTLIRTLWKRSFAPWEKTNLMDLHLQNSLKIWWSPEFSGKLNMCLTPCSLLIHHIQE